MKNAKSLLAVVALFIAVNSIFALKMWRAKHAVIAPPVAEKPATLPRLVDLGADKCIPCKMMAPILEDLKKTYAGKLEVEFIDVWKNQGAGQQYGVRVIPTQIFFDADEKELFRHEGFYSKEDILGKFKELGMISETPNE